MTSQEAAGMGCVTCQGGSAVLVVIKSLANSYLYFELHWGRFFSPALEGEGSWVALRIRSFSQFKPNFILEHFTVAYCCTRIDFEFK